MNIGMGSQAHHTDHRSQLDVQPSLDGGGLLLVYDGRLDNHRDLQRELNDSGQVLSDTEIVLRAYRRWGSDCFARFIGDWSLSLWDPTIRTLFLARDHAGARTLYYSRDDSGTVIWSTYLDSFSITDHVEVPDPLYVASYLAMLPVYSRSPFLRIHAVLPGHFLSITVGGIRATQFWTPMVYDQISYGSDGDYESHFLSLLEQAVSRRDRPGTPRLAHLSGGMDSASIVCVSDNLRKSQQASPDLIDTLSYFDDSEPSWNERPYFTLVEERRGKAGLHVDASRYRDTYAKPMDVGALYLYPGIDQGSIRRDLDLREISRSNGYRSILSGIGGDEFTGGAPDIASELADYLVAGKLISGTRASIAWCLASRMCLLDSLTQSVRFLSNHLSSAYLDAGWSAIPWLTSHAREMCYASIRELPIVRYSPFTTRPSAISSCEMWWYTLRTQPHLKPSEVYRYEYRYPFLDRDLVDFLLRVPRDQLAKPGRRRFLMRRALKGIVPAEILERRRKAFLLTAPLAQVSELAPRFHKLIDSSVLAELGYVEKVSLRQALNNTTSGRDIRWWPFLLRTIGIERWLRTRVDRGAQSQHTQVLVDVN
jgi:asparagine synthase (glutamine-hydrolysing)